VFLLFWHVIILNKYKRNDKLTVAELNITAASDMPGFVIQAQQYRELFVRSPYLITADATAMGKTCET
jgi:hypothetical protein